MTYFIDEYLDITLRNLTLCPSVDISISFRGSDTVDFSDDIDVMVFWNSPNSSTNWYPIGQIDHGLKTIFHREGSENPDCWNNLLNEMADFISRLDFSAR